MRAFVTGSTGFIGRHLVQELLDHGDTVTALVRTFERTRQLPRSVRAVPADITQPDLIRQNLDGVDALFHLAAVHQVGARPADYKRLQRINIDGARRVLALATEAGVPRIIHVSTVAVYGDTRGRAVDETYRPGGIVFQSECQRTKHAAHFQVAVPLQTAGAPLIIACPGAVYGPGDRSGLARLLSWQARGRLLALIGPDAARSWTYVGDVAAGLRLAAERGRPGATYHLTGPAHSLREFFAASAQTSGVLGPLVWLPSALAGWLARALNGVAPALAERLRVVAGVTYLGRAALAESELGWRARPLADGLPPTVAALRKSQL